MSNIVSKIRGFLSLHGDGDVSETDFLSVFQDLKTEDITLIASELANTDTSDPIVERRAACVLAELTSRISIETEPDAVNALIIVCLKQVQNSSTMSAALQGMLQLCTNRDLEQQAAIEVLQSVLFNLQVQKLAQSQRQNIFGIVHALLQNNTKAVSTLTDEFIPKFIQAMDGERDPRNLVIAFKTLKLMTRLLDVSKCIEDLFELLWCYFPITFKPPPNDPYAITTEELKRHLRECIAATPYFSKFAMPSLQEKLEHPSDTVKKEAIATLTLCAPVYGAHALLPGISEIFNVLSSQIFYAKDGDMQELALNSIHVITSTLATGISIAAISNPIERSLDPLIDECMVALKQPEHKNARSAIAILRSAASASDPACTSIVDRVIPSLLAAYQNAYNDSERIAILDLIIEIMDASRTLYGTMDGLKVDRDFMTPLLAYKTHLLTLYVQVAKSSTDILQYKGCHGLYIMAASRHFLTDDEVSGVVDILTRICCDSGNNLLRKDSLASIRKIGLFCPDTVINTAIPYLISNLQNEEKKRYTLGLLCHLGTISAMYEVVALKLSQEFIHACANDHQYAEFILSNIIDATEEGLANKSFLEQEEAWSEVLQRVMITVAHCAQHMPLSITTLNLLAYWLANILRRLSLETQMIQSQFAFSIFAQAEHDSSSSDSSLPHINVLIPEVPESIASLSCIFAAIFCNCRKEVWSHHMSTSDSPMRWVKSATESLNSTQITTLSQLAAVYVNHCIQDISMMERFFDEALTNYINPTIDTLHDGHSNGLTALIWLAKASVTSGKSMKLVTNILDTLPNSRVGQLAANGFQIIAADNVILLNKQSFSKVSYAHEIWSAWPKPSHRAVPYTWQRTQAGVHGKSNRPIPISGASTANTKDECEVDCSGTSQSHNRAITTGSQTAYPIDPADSAQVKPCQIG
ncbi:hypothetical protein NQZ79_g3079 [Umbelopsis isabellina]|nr:hypothetical protein NQZ79_g3079 [Umbelopsis isabellina]